MYGCAAQPPLQRTAAFSARETGRVLPAMVLVGEGSEAELPLSLFVRHASIETALKLQSFRG